MPEDIATPPAPAERYSSNVVSIQRGSELDALKKLSTLVYDTKYAANEMAELGRQAATVSPSVLLHFISENHGSDMDSVEGAMVYEACKIENIADSTEESRTDCVLDKAFVNLAAMMADRVPGVVSVEVIENRLAANDAESICAKARRMRDMLLELDVDIANRILFKIPCTWEGIQAVGQLEDEGIKCHVTQVYCLEQAAAAARAGASLVQVYVGRVRTWYQKHPIAAVHNNLGDAPDTGIELVKQISALIRAENLHTKTIAASVKNKKDAVALAGCDYILLNDRVIANLNSVNVVGAFTNTFQSSGSAPFVKPITKESFTHALKNSPGLEELTHALSANAAADAKLKEFIATSISSGVGQ